MPNPKVLDTKKRAVAELSEQMRQSLAVVMTDYRGLTVQQDTELRVALRKSGVTYRVVKNTLSKRAFQDAGVTGLDEVLNGPTALAYSKSDVVAPAKVIKEYADKFEKLTIKGGVLEGKAISAADVTRLSMIPGKEVLYGQVVCGLLAPIAGLAVLLNAIREKMETAGSSPEPATAGA